MRPSKTERLIYLGMLLAVLIVSAMVGCGQPTYYPPPQQVVIQQPVQSAQDYQIIQDPYSGQQMAVFYDNGVQMMVQLAIFNSMMSMGGYGYVVHHYHDYPGYTRYDRARYSSWHLTSRGSYNTYKAPSSSQFRNTTPAGAAPSQFRNTSPRTTSGSSFRSTTPVSSSSGFRSTSPSRSSGGGFRRTH